MIYKFAIRISTLTIFSFNNLEMNKNVGSLISISAVKNQEILGNKATWKDYTALLSKKSAE